jgi:hypothetical protein
MATQAAGSDRVHTDEVFQFVAQGRLSCVFPLFGAHGERLWAPGWEPRFVWPAAPEDRLGMVFEVDRDGRTATWINTLFDSASGRIQYVYVLPEIVATVITLELHAQGDATEVKVRYQRTSLAASADTRVEAMAAQDRAAGPEWAREINRVLRQLGSG